MAKEVDDYIAKLEPIPKEWISYFVDYMRKNHKDLEECIYYTRPTYKLKGVPKNYVMFSNATKDFSLHTMDEEYIPIVRKKLSKPGNGKQSVKVPYENVQEREIIINAIEEIIKQQNKQ